MSSGFYGFRISNAVALQDVPQWDAALLRRYTIDAVLAGKRLIAFFGMQQDNATQLFVILADDSAGMLYAARSVVAETYPAFTPDCSQAHLFEREIAEQCGATPLGHPWLKPVRGMGAGKRPQITEDFFAMKGAAIHEVAVGPVHAGIIEPGHFRFQCYGEHVYHLEIALGYQHRGVEEMMCTRPQMQRLPLAETIAGDTTIGHALAHTRLFETLSGAHVSARAGYIRAIALELERLANHIGDMGALAHDVAFLPTAAYCGRLRGDFLNMTAVICGNRFGRGILSLCDIDARVRDALRARLETAYKDAQGAVDLLFTTPSVLERFEATGVLSSFAARALGVVGVSARACGINIDCRRNFDVAPYGVERVSACTHADGDVFARAWVRKLEIEQSVSLVRELLHTMPEGEAPCVCGPLTADSLAVSLVEGWRGQIAHIAITGADGACLRYKIIDPSFFNWAGLAYALRDQQISDFPLCNKSFNLSYCGFDL